MCAPGWLEQQCRSVIFYCPSVDQSAQFQMDRGGVVALRGGVSSKWAIYSMLLYLYKKLRLDP